MSHMLFCDSILLEFPFEWFFEKCHFFSLQKTIPSSRYDFTQDEFAFANVTICQMEISLKLKINQIH